MSETKFGNVSVLSESETSETSDVIKNPDRITKTIPKYTPEYQRLNKDPVVNSYDPSLFATSNKNIDVPTQMHANVGQNSTWFDQTQQVAAQAKPSKNKYNIGEGQYCLLLRDKIYAITNDKEEIESVVESLLFDGSGYNIDDVVLIKRIHLKIGVIADD